MSMGTAPRGVGKYELLVCLGRAGTVEVWKAWDTQRQRDVAIKILHADFQHDPGFLTRFHRQAQALASLRHPNIVHVYDCQLSRSLDSEGTIAYLAMEYVEGPTLADFIARTSRIRQFPPLEDIVRLFTCIGSALDYAHQHGILHHDVQAANILLDQRNTAGNSMGDPLLTDLGTATLPGSSPAPHNDSLAGTQLYSAPERVQGHAGEKNSTIFSLGVILYEVCTGVRPFSGERTISMLRQHTRTLPPSPSLMNPAIPPAVSEVILHCLAKDSAARFPDAASLSAALAQALNTPAPSATIAVTPRSPDTTPDMRESSPAGSVAHSKPLAEADTNQGRESPRLGTPSLPGSTIVSDMHPTPDATGHVSASATHQQARPATSPTPEISHASAQAARAKLPLSIQRNAASQVASIRRWLLKGRPPSPPAVTFRRRNGRWLMVLMIIMLIVIIGASLQAFFSFVQKSPPSVPMHAAAGQAFFVSSGQLNKKGYPALNDELQINLHNLPEPTPGTGYYAWLLRDTTQSASMPILLGKLAVKRGEVHFLYPGDREYSDLLAVASRVLITQEDARITPLNPALDLSTWRYYAELPQQPDPGDGVHHSGMLTHLRSLLSEDPVTAGKGLPGGLAIWLLRNTGKVVEWANSARDYWPDSPTDLMRAHLIRILDYLDGESFVQADVPDGTPLVISAPIGLLGPEASPGGTSGAQVQASYLHLMSAHLNAIAQAPGTTPEQRRLAAQINTGMKNVGNWLAKVRVDARHLLSLTDAQLLSREGLSVLNDMVTQAFYAYVGRLDPTTNQVQAGAVQVNYDTEHLATFEIKPYTLT